MVEAIPRTGGVDVDATFDLLSSRRRRTVLGLLTSKIAPTTMEDLVDAIQDSEPSGGLRPENHRYRIATSLYHVHLPKLSRAGMIDVDTDRSLVTPRLGVFDAEPYLALARADERQGSR